MSARSGGIAATALFALALALVGLGAPDGPESAAAAPGDARAEHVVLVGFDGFDPDYLGRVATPNLDALIARGVGGTTEGIMLPITNPSFTSLTTGAWPDRHGNRANWWDKSANRYRGQSRANGLTSIADHVVDAGGSVGSAQYFILQGNGTDYGRAGAVYTQPGGACSRKFDDAISMLRREPVDSAGTTVPVDEIPTLLAVYCGDLDAIGHDEGADSPNIAPALAELDAQVGRLVAAIDEAGIADTTSIVLTGDHGMSTYDRSFGFPLFQALQAAGYTPQFLFADPQSVDATTDVVLIASGRAMVLYLAGPLEGDADALAAVRAIAEGVAGTGAILDRTDQAARHMSPDYGDLIIESEPGWGAAILPPTSPRGDHGSSAETDAVFVMAGAGVADRDEPASVRHIDVAPTIAELLGLDPLPDADGSALLDLLIGDDPPTTTTSTSTTETTASPTTSTTTPTSDRSNPDPPAVEPAVAAEARRAQPTYTG